MSEIEKLYKNAGIEPIVRDNAIGRGYYIEHQRVEEYPTFTAEKQIEIIKFLVGKHARFDMFKDYEQKDLYMVHYECKYFPKQYFPFEEALAESISYLWKDLTETEQEGIRKILKG